ncbi:MAG: hypothetical protein JWO36_6305, partial [Myxococcales bacterium]|nr:hypothetical protein [Myxococcales bacterium]
MVGPVPDDDKRRRLGDETKSRIADLSSGWTVESAEPGATPDIEPAPAAPRKRPRTMPPPPPGSAERKALEEVIVATKEPPAVPRIALGDVKRDASAPVAAPVADGRSGSVRPKVPTAPPPIPRSKPASRPPIPKAADLSGPMIASGSATSGAIPSTHLASKSGPTAQLP